MIRKFYRCILVAAMFSAVCGCVIRDAFAQDEPGQDVLQYGNPPRPVAMPEKMDGDFRAFIWGVSKADVRAYETAAFYREEPNALFLLNDRPRRITAASYGMISGTVSCGGLNMPFRN